MSAPALAFMILLLSLGCGSPSPSSSAPAAVPEAPTAVPELRAWETRMVDFGQRLCDRLTTARSTGEVFDHLYYDAARVFFQIADYTGDARWTACARRAAALYRDGYVIPNQGKVPGYWTFTHGLAMDHLRTGDPASKEAVMLLSQNAAFAADSTPLEWTAEARYSREVAYTIMSYLNAERLGAPRRPRLRQLVDQSLDHIDQWFVSGTAASIQPFMVGLTAEALVMYFEVTPDPRIPPAIRTAMDWLSANAWVLKDSAFWYESGDKTSGSPDLNLLIAPAYAWLYRYTGDRAYRDRGDQVFAGGVKRAYLEDGKHFNQNYRWSFDYVRWRSAPRASSKHRIPRSLEGPWS